MDVDDTFSPAISWAMICSIPDSERSNNLEKLKEFGCWLTQKMAERTIELGIQQWFASNLTTFITVDPDDFDANHAAYRSISLNYPDVILIIHILPVANSSEYNWMKSLSQQYGLIRQGVLFANALDHFESVESDLPSVIGNIVQWVNRRLAELTFSKTEELRSFSVQVTVDGDGQEKKRTNFARMTIPEMARNVDHVLHGDINDTGIEFNASSSLLAQVEVSGFPRSYSEFQVASLLSDFAVLCVTTYFEGRALVELSSKFQAAQACHLLNGRQVDEGHFLKVVPMHQEVLAQIIV